MKNSSLPIPRLGFTAHPLTLSSLCLQDDLIGVTLQKLSSRHFLNICTQNRLTVDYKAYITYCTLHINYEPDFISVTQDTKLVHLDFNTSQTPHLQKKKKRDLSM